MFAGIGESEATKEESDEDDKKKKKKKKKEDKQEEKKATHPTETAANLMDLLDFDQPS